MIEKFTHYLMVGNKKDMSSFLKRVIWTCFFIFLYRLGSYIPIPGIEIPFSSSTSNWMIESDVSNMFNRFDLLLGGGTGRMSLFSLHLIPLLSSQLLFHFVISPMPYFQRLKKKGKSDTIQHWIQMMSLFLAIVQSSFLSHYLFCSIEDLGLTTRFLPVNFYLASISFMTIGFMILSWLAQRITQYGIGQGVSVILFFGIISELSQRIISILDSSHEDEAISIFFFLGSIFCCFLSLLLIWKGEKKLDFIPLVSPRSFFQRRKPYPLYLNIPFNFLGIMPMIINSFLFSCFYFYISNNAFESFNENELLLLSIQSILFLFSCFFCYLFLLSKQIQKEWIMSLKKENIFFSSLEKDSFFYIRFMYAKKLYVNIFYLWFIYMIPLVCEYFCPIFSTVGLSGITLFLLVRILYSTVYKIQSDFLTHHFPFGLRIHSHQNHIATNSMYVKKESITSI